VAICNLSLQSFLITSRRPHSYLYKEKEELTPYSFRHHFAYYSHNRQQEDRTYLSPKQVAGALVHILDTHLLGYTRFNTRILAESFDQQPVLKNPTPNSHLCNHCCCGGDVGL
tara:strand:- start:134 stop:472 length:339 start_codon:yes stop_codon:yes gene_type:complete